MRFFFDNTIKTSALIVCALVLLACVFDFQYSILIGPFLDFLLLFGLIVLGLILSLIFIATNGIRKRASYVPFSLLIMAFCFYLLPNFNLGHQVHFLLNKGNLESINSLSQRGHVYEMTDMLRYQKRLNKASLSNEQKYTTQKQIVEAFGDYIRKENLDSQKISEIRSRLEKSDIISILRTEDYLILTVDGFVDNEYGYLKTNKKGLKVEDTLPPFGFRIVRLIEFDNGWYFFYTT